jgi:hypothetical protein
MKIANVKEMIAKGMMAAMVAGTLMVASPAKASAQGFAVGVRVGAPYYGYGRGYEFDRRQEFLRREEFARREAFLRHEEWARGHRFDRPYGYYR